MCWRSTQRASYKHQILFAPYPSESRALTELNQQADPHQFLLFDSKTTGLRQSFALTCCSHIGLTAKTPGTLYGGASRRFWECLETRTRRLCQCRWTECGVMPCQRFTFFYTVSRRHAPLLCDVWRVFRDSEIGVGQIIRTVADWMEPNIGVSYGWHRDTVVVTNLTLRKPEWAGHLCTMAAYRTPREILEWKTILWSNSGEAKGQVDRRGDQRWEKNSSDRKIDKLVLDRKIRRKFSGARARNWTLKL